MSLPGLKEMFIPATSIRQIPFPRYEGRMRQLKPYAELRKMADRIVDQVARDAANTAISLISKHEAVCEEAEKNRERFRVELKEWVARIQTMWEAGQRDLSERLEASQTDLSDRNSRGINTLADNWSRATQEIRTEIRALSTQLSAHSEQDTKNFAEIAKQRSFFSGWKAAALMALGGLYAVTQMGLSIYSALHHQ